MRKLITASVVALAFGTLAQPLAAAELRMGLNSESLSVGGEVP